MVFGSSGILGREIILDNVELELSSVNFVDGRDKGTPEILGSSVELFCFFDLLGYPSRGNYSGYGSNNGEDFVHSDFLVFYLALLNGLICLFTFLRRK